MAKSYFIIPDTGTIVYNGDTVILAEYPDVMAVAAYGWYKHNQASEMGWHFVLLLTNQVIPVSDVNLSLLTIVSNSSCDHRPPMPIPCPGPGPDQMNERTFITLDSIAQLKKLKTMFMPNGRIVRINNRGDGKPGYYVWNVMEQDWDDWEIAEDTPVPENVLKLKELGVVNSVDSTQFIDPYIYYAFKAGTPLCTALDIPENTLCELRYSEIYQIIKVVATQDTYIRQVYQTTPDWIASEWFASSDQQRLAILESHVDSHALRLDELELAIDNIKQNDLLENVLTGAPRLSEEELNTLLEARLNGEDVDI